MAVETIDGGGSTPAAIERQPPPMPDSTPQAPDAEPRNEAAGADAEAARGNPEPADDGESPDRDQGSKPRSDRQIVLPSTLEVVDPVTDDEEDAARSIERQRQLLHDDPLASVDNPDIRRAEEGMIPGYRTRARTELQEALETEMRTAGRDQINPIPNNERLVEGLVARAPHDPTYRAAVDEARATVEADWRAAGRDEWGIVPIYQRFARAEAADARLETLSRNPVGLNPAIRADLEKDAEVAWDDVQFWMDRSLRQAVSSEADREAAIAPVYKTFETYGPPNTKYYQILDDTLHHVLVIDPAEQVAKTYEDEGAVAASDELVELTASASPTLTAQILAATQPTVVQIANDFNAVADFSDPGALAGEETAAPSPDDVARSPHQRVFGNLSLVVEHASWDHRFGPEATRDTALAFAAGVRDDSLQTGAHTTAVQDTVHRDGSATLALAIAQELAADDKPRHADAYLRGTAEGIEALQTDLTDGVQAFDQAVAPVVGFLDEWSGLLPAERLEAAVNAQMGETTIGADADAAVERYDRAALGLLRTHLAVQHAPVVNQESDGATALQTTIDRTREIEAPLGFAVATGPQAQAELQRLLLSPERATATAASDRVESYRDQFGDGGVGGPTVNTPKQMRDSRSALKEVMKYLATTSSTGTAGDIPDPTAGTTPLGKFMNGVGVITYGSTTYANAERLVTGTSTAPAIDTVATLHGLFGLSKETAELTAGFVLSNPVTGQAPTNAAERTALQHTAGLVSSSNPAWQAFSNNIKYGGAAVDTLRMFNAVNQHDQMAAALYGMSAFGGAVSTVKQIGGVKIPGPLWGAGLAFVATTGIQLHTKTKADADESALLREMLVNAGLNPAFAQELGTVSSNDASVGPRLLALAEQQGMPPSELMAYLETQPSGDVSHFVEMARSVDADADGQFAMGDEPGLYENLGEPGFPHQYRQDPNIILSRTPSTIWELAAWAHAKGFDAIDPSIGAPQPAPTP